MKRGAEKQIAREDREEEDEISEPGQGFRKADESVLATRKIRALPKRMAGSQSSSGTVTPEAPPPAVPKFGGFGGFGGLGTAGAGTSSFNFAAPAKPVAAPAPVPPASAFPSVVPSSSSTSTLSSTPFNLFGTPAVPSATSNLFGAPVASSTSPNPFAAPAALPNPFAAPTASSTAPISFATPAVSSSASSAAKTFASFLGTPSEPKPSTNGVRAQNGTTAEDATLKAETKYYRALRGLNVSFVDVITKAVDKDPFLDIAEVLEQYKTLRARVRQEYDDEVKKADSSASSAPAAPASSLGAAKAPSAPTPPAAPSTPFNFGGVPAASFEPKSTSSTSNSSLNFGSKPSGAAQPKPAASMPAPPTAFAGFNPPPTTSSSNSTGGGFTPKLDSPSLNPFSFGSSSSSSTTSGISTTSPFALGPAASKSSFTFGESSSKPSEATAAPSIFSSNLFSGADVSKDNAKETIKPTSSSTSGSGPFSGSFPVANKSSTSTSTSTKSLLGAGSLPTKPAFGFGSTGSIGNPIGFSFGSPPKTPDETKPAPSSSFGNFSFGPAPIKTAESSETGGDTEASSRADTPAGDAPAPLVATTSVHDLTGEGEDDEETEYEVRTKVYRMEKNAGGAQEWADVGVGILRVKVHKETGTRRLLLRNSSTGKVTINFNVYNGMNPSVSKNVVSFMGHDDGHSVPFKLRVKTAEAADDLKNALDREIEFVKSKSD